MVRDACSRASRKPPASSPLTDLCADHDHEVGDGLAFVDEDSLDGAVQHADAQSPHLALVLEDVLKRNKSNSLVNEGAAPRLMSCKSHLGSEMAHSMERVDEMAEL